MAQLSSFTLHDYYLLSLCTSILTSYFSEEIEAGVESIAPYIYSAA